jgi:ubiquinone biosynthesis protein
MEFIEGRPLREGGTLALPRKRRATLARSLAQAYLQMFFLDGVFHADPHPGNLFLTRDRRIGLLDFGMVGRIERQVSDNLIRVLLNFVLKDSHGVAHAFLDIGKPTASADEIGWIMDVRRLLPRYHGMSIQKLNVGTLLIDLYRCAARNRIQAPPIVALVCKSLATMDGSARLIHPEIDLVAEFRRFLPRILKDHARRMASLENNAKLALDVAIGAQRIPFQVATILEKAATGRLRVVVDPLGIDKVASQIGKVANRVALGQIVGSWLVARAINKRDQPPARIPTEQFEGPRLESLGALAARLGELEGRADRALAAARERKSHG